jgi:hypothetical protein
VVFIYNINFPVFLNFRLTGGEAARREFLRTGRIGKMMKLRHFVYARKKEEFQ